MSEGIYIDLGQPNEVREELICSAMLEEGACRLQDDDKHCGQIFFSESTRVLKYMCMFCKYTSDNINYYCDHLSTHIRDDVALEEDGQLQHYEEEENIVDTTVVEMGSDNAYYYDDILSVNDGNEMLEAIEPMKFQETQIDNIVDGAVVNPRKQILFNTIPDGTVLCKPSDSGQQLSQNTNLSPNTNCSAENNETAMDFENIIVATNIKGNLKHIAEKEQNNKISNIKKKRKKITTVKVIAVRNRITELYEKIKSEEEKRSKLNNIDAIKTDEEENVDSFENTKYIMADNVGCSKKDSVLTTKQNVRGETAIRVLPNNIKLKRNFPDDNNSEKPSSDDKLEKGKRKPREFVCPACGMQFRSTFSLSIHKRTHYLESNSEVKLAHKCSDCNRLFNKITEMKKHLESEHYPDGFICRICQKKLNSLALLEKHMRQVHLNRPFSCTICHKSFGTQTLLEAHGDAHMERRNYKCDTCGRKYGTEQLLKLHMRRHKKQVPTCCVVCGKMTLRITQHMKTHTPRPKRLHNCNLCGKYFNFSSGLSHHITRMHKLPRPQRKKTKKELITAQPRRRKVNTKMLRKRNFRRQSKNDIVEGAPLVKMEKDPLDVQNEEQQNVNQVVIVMHHGQPHELQQRTHYADSCYSEQDVDEKEEEAKRVIVELIQNATCNSFLPVHHMDEFEVPIAREETITAINSIVKDC